MQTLSGKTPYGIAKAAHKEGMPVLLLSGTIDEESREFLKPLFAECYALTDETVPIEQA